MKFAPIAISAATPAQLRAFAEMNGLDIASTDNDLTVMAKIGAAFPGSQTISAMVDEAPAAPLVGSPPVDPAATVVSNVALTNRGDRDPRVIVQLNEIEGASKEQEVQVNGWYTNIKRGVQADISYRAYLALRDAVRVTYTMDPNTGLMSEQNVQAHPFNVIKMPPQSEIDAWHAATDHLEVA